MQSSWVSIGSIVFFFNDTATTEIYTLSLHDALPISRDALTDGVLQLQPLDVDAVEVLLCDADGNLFPSEEPAFVASTRSEEHTSELQSRQYLVCRLLLEKKTSSKRRRGPASRR